MPVDRRESAAGKGTGRARSAGPTGTNGGEHLTQSEEPAGLHQNDPAGTDGESGAAGIIARGDANRAGRNWAAFEQVESVAAIQQAGGARGKRGRSLRCGGSD